MSPCASCGREARPVLGRLLAVPVLLGVAGAIGVGWTKGSSAVVPVLIGLGAAFGLFVAFAVRLGLRIWSGLACATCGRAVGG